MNYIIFLLKGQVEQQLPQLQLQELEELRQVLAQELQQVLKVLAVLLQELRQEEALQNL